MAITFAGALPRYRRSPSRLAISNPGTTTYNPRMTRTVLLTSARDNSGQTMPSGSNAALRSNIAHLAASFALSCDATCADDTSIRYQRLPDRADRILRRNHAEAVARSRRKNLKVFGVDAIVTMGDTPCSRRSRHATPALVRPACSSASGRLSNRRCGSIASRSHAAAINQVYQETAPRTVRLARVVAIHRMAAPRSPRNNALGE